MYVTDVYISDSATIYMLTAHYFGQIKEYSLDIKVVTCIVQKIDVHQTKMSYFAFVSA